MAQRIISSAAERPTFVDWKKFLNLKHRQRVAGATLCHGVNDIELLDRLNHAE